MWSVAIILALPLFEEETTVPKGYLVTTYRSIKNPDGVAAYAKLACPAMEAAGDDSLCAACLPKCTSWA